MIVASRTLSDLAHLLMRDRIYTGSDVEPWLHADWMELVKKGSRNILAYVIMLNGFDVPVYVSFGRTVYCTYDSCLVSNTRYKRLLLYSYY
jgi:hypothetical protein